MSACAAIDEMIFFDDAAEGKKPAERMLRACRHFQNKNYRLIAVIDNRAEAEPAHIFCIDRALEVMHLQGRAVREMTRIDIDPRMLARPDFMLWDLLNTKARNEIVPSCAFARHDNLNVFQECLSMTCRSIKHNGLRMNKCIIVTGHQTCKEKQCYGNTDPKHFPVRSGYDSCVSICCGCVCFPQRNSVVGYIAPRVSVFDAAYFLTDMLSGSYRPRSAFDNRTEAEPAHIFCIDKALEVMHLQARAVREMARMDIDPLMLPGSACTGA